MGETTWSRTIGPIVRGNNRHCFLLFFLEIYGGDLLLYGGGDLKIFGLWGALSIFYVYEPLSNFKQNFRKN